MFLDEEEELECEVCGIRLKNVLEFKYLRCVVDESATDERKWSKKMANGRIVVGPIRSLVNTRSLQLECARVLHESLLVPVLTYDVEQEGEL